MNSSIKWILFLIFLIPNFSNAQQNQVFDSLRRELFNISVRDSKEAFIYLDTLSMLARTRNEEIKVQMMAATLYYQQGDKAKALQIAIDAEENYRKNRDYSDQVATIGFISSNFREFGFFHEAEYYLNKAEKSIRKMPKGNLRGQYGTLLNHEKSFIYLHKKMYPKVGESLQESYKYLEEIDLKEMYKYLLATTLQLDADNEYRLQNYDKAQRLYQEALEALNTKDELIYGLILLGMAKIALINKDYKVAHHNLLEVEEIVEKSLYLPLKIEMYKAYMDYYDLKQDVIAYEKYHYLYLNSIDIENEDLKKTADFALLGLRSKVAKGRFQNKSILGSTLGLTFILCSIIFVMYQRSVKRKERFAYVMNQLREGKTIQNIETSKQTSIPKTEEKIEKIESGNSVEDNIAVETEQRILELLDKLEREEKFFLNPELNLTKLAFEMEINIRYLSYVINKHRERNFKTYINDLRIHYILKLLQEDPKYSKYKISYLAQESGFSSHSKFSAEFKRVVGLSPSVFISKLK